jgi:hypothetical protein
VPVDYLVANSFFGLGAETTWDTPVMPGFWIPMLDPKWTTKLKWLPDEALYGSPAHNRDQVPGPRYDEFSIKHSMYQDSIANFLRAALGSTDTVTGTGPYTHTIGLLNSPTTGSQPPSYTIDYFDASQTRQLAGSRLNTFTLTFGADVAVEAVSTFVCMPETDVTLPTQTLSTAHFVPGWDMVLDLGTVQSAVIVSGELSIERQTEAIFTATGQQAPHNVFAGPIIVKGKVKFVLEGGDATFANSLVRDQFVAKLIFTDPVSAAAITFQMSAFQFMNPVLDISKKWLQVDAEFSAVDNSADALSGLSPLKAIVVNSQASAY